MIINTTTKFEYGDVVNYRREETVPWKTGRIRSLKLIQHDAFRPDAFMIYYLIEPIELVGLEHDEEEWILEHESTLVFASPPKEKNV